MSSAQQHIADDPERLEDYVLGRMTDDDAAAVALHARTCPRCSEAIDAELRLAAAVRRAGRDAAKERLRAEVVGTESAARAGVPWPKVLSIAATVAVLIGLGITGRWLTVHHGETRQSARNLSPMTTEKPSPPATEVRPAESPEQNAHPRPDMAYTPPQQKEEEHTELLKDQLAQPQTQLLNQNAKRTPDQTITHQEYAPEAGVQPAASAEAVGRGEVAVRSSGADRAVDILRRPILVSLRLRGADHAAKTLARSTIETRNQPAPDTSVTKVTLVLPETDSALLRCTPVARWITADSISVRLGDSTYGVHVGP